MICESLARRFRPAGFEQPEGFRKNYVKPRAELQYTFDRWVNGLPENWYKINTGEEYNKACELVKPIGEIPYREASSLLAGSKSESLAQRRAGLFVSACYNQSPEQIIAFDTDAPEINLIGYRLGENRVLVNNGKVGNWFASRSSGVIVNNGESGVWFCYNSSGIVLNNGESGDLFGYNSSGILIALQEPKSYGHKEKGRIIKPADCDRIPELKKYLEELSETARNIKDEMSARKFIEKYGASGERIGPEINRLLSIH